MRVKADEDLPQAVVVRLREAGYDAEGVYSQGMSGWSDAQLWQTVQDEARFRIAADKGFGDIRTYAPGTHEGVLLLRPQLDGIGPLVDLLNRVLNGYTLEDLVGTVTVASPRGIRIRRSQ